MKAIFVLTLVLSLFTIPAVSKEAPLSKKFGGQISESPALQLNEVIENYKNYKDKTLVIEANVEKVCEQKGCWIVLTDGKNSVRTLFKDYGFFVPKEILKQKVKVQGVMEQKSVSVATQKHYLKDAGVAASEINKVTASKMEYQFTADAVEIL